MYLKASKADFEHFLECVTDGKPLAPASGKWTQSSALACAAVLFHTCMANELSSATGLVGDDLASGFERNFEQHEAKALTTRCKTHSALYHLSFMYACLLSGEWDQYYDPQVAFVMERMDEEMFGVKRVYGFRGEEPGLSAYRVV